METDVASDQERQFALQLLLVDIYCRVVLELNGREFLRSRLLSVDVSEADTQHQFRSDVEAL